MRTTIAGGWSSLVMLVLLAGCGGGGDEGGGGSLPALTYSGNTSQAVITGTNASRLIVNVFGSSDAAGIISGMSLSQGGTPAGGVSGGLVSVTRTINRAARKTPVLQRASAGQRLVSGVAVNDVEPCDGGGTVRLQGTLSDSDGTGTLTITFSNCQIEGVTLNGQGSFHVANPDLSDFTMSFSRIQIRGPGVNVDGGGSLRVETNIVTHTETLKNNLITLNNLTGVMTMGQNLSLAIRYDDIENPTLITSMTIVSGQLFDNVHGFVDVSTPTPLAFFSLTQLFPDSGSIRLVGNASNVLVEAQSSARLRFAPDLGNAALMYWTDLAGPVGADIGDTDSDGMHNSWETFYGLNPMFNDAGDNLDGDGATNLAEYQAGTNPNGP